MFTYCINFPLGAANGVCSCSDSNYTCNCKEAPLSNITYKGSVCNCDPDECVNRDVSSTTLTVHVHVLACVTRYLIF